MSDPLRSGKRVLVMDDDQDARTLTTAVVEALGHQPETARDDIEALAKLRLGVDLVRDLLTGRSIRITAAVPSLVVCSTRSPANGLTSRRIRSKRR
jgi:CheY-like chemotaxis protein